VTQTDLADTRPTTTHRLAFKRLRLPKLDKAAAA
jgi:hypothetical protein